MSGFDANGKRSTRLEDLADRAGVSISTVSRALNDSPAVNMRTKQAIWKLARELDYPFRSSMPSGPIGADGTIAIVAPLPQSSDLRLPDAFLSELVSGIAEATRSRKYDVLLSHVSPRNLEELEYALSTSRADGVVFIGQGWLHAAFNKLAASEARFVVCGAELPDQAYCSVGSDNLAGGRRAAQHLARLGRRRILFLGDTEAPEALQRYRGYVDGLAYLGLEVDPDLVIHSHFDIESAYAGTEALLRRGVAFDGVFAPSGLIALGAMKALISAGKDVPGDVSIVGYDNAPFSRYSSPALSTINLDTSLAGRLLVSKLLDSDGSASRSERLPTELLVRDTCGG